MKVIFLDIDGVLNSDEAVEQLYKVGKYTTAWFMEKALVARLNYLIERTDAKVVISSTWRHDMDTTRAWLGKCEFKGEIIGRTPKLHTRRGFEIQHWLDDNKELGVEKFVILDDDCDMEHLHPFLVHISNEIGLQDWNVEAAVGVLINGD